jgi:hypothetical protein
MKILSDGGFIVSDEGQYLEPLPTSYVELSDEQFLIFGRNTADERTNPYVVFIEGNNRYLLNRNKLGAIACELENIKRSKNSK